MKPLILLRGLFRGQHHWGDFPKKLSEKLVDYDVRCLDIPGTGELFHQDSPSSISAIVDALRAQVSNEQPLSLLSLSMGGMIALNWAERYPDDVKQIIAINTSSQSLSPFYHRLRPANYSRLCHALLSTPVQRETLVYQAVSNQPLNNRIIHRWVHLNECCKLRKINLFRQLKAAFNFKAMKPLCPLTLIASEQDNLVNVECSKVLSHHWDCPLLIHPTAGHDLPLDDPEWLCEQIETSLNINAKTHVADNPRRTDSARVTDNVLVTEKSKGSQK
ncbi:alpha/beta fold hydrolase [Vibrio maerlii]|uniref:alpha/beta fold hydrolase n=1 Tax=Vibrio maerlii TaxID=2231648 RepID=UPI000E3DFEBE|nr:alpha/beta hydrolase [Vibrio maerlii]